MIVLRKQMQLNLFSAYAMAASYDKEAARSILALKGTFSKFRVPPHDQANVGDLILRFSLYLQRNNKPFKLEKLNVHSRLSIGKRTLINMFEDFSERLNTVRMDHD